jgi:hypothetical protein
MFGWTLVRSSDLQKQRESLQEAQDMAAEAQAVIEAISASLAAMVAEQKKTNVRLAAIIAEAEESGNLLAQLSGRGVVTNQRLRRVERLLSKICLMAFPPGPMQVVITGEEIRGDGMADLVTFEAVLPPLSEPHDVVKRHVKVHVDGVLISETIAAPGDEKVTGLSGDQGQTAVVTLQDEDDGGNLSEVTTATVVLADTVPPGAPGELGLVITGEVIDGGSTPPVEEPTEPTEPPVEEPTPTEPPAEEPPAEPTPTEEPPIG